MTRVHPEIGEAIAIHDALIGEFGGTPGIRDEGALAAAIMRPQLGYYDSLVEEAAALMESLANYHPFVDGNKRAAFFVTDAFLRLNGSFIDGDSVETHEFFMGLFGRNSFRFAELRAWLGGNVRPLLGSG